MTDEEHIRIVEGWLELGEPEEAQKELSLLGDDRQADRDVQALELRILLALGYEEPALKVAEGFMDQNPELLGAPTCLELATVLAFFKEFDLARAWLETALELDHSEEMWEEFMNNCDLDMFWVEFERSRFDSD